MKQKNRKKVPTLTMMINEKINKVKKNKEIRS